MPSRAPDTTDDRAPGGPPGLPRWVKLLAIGILIAAVILVVAMLLVGGEHGPGMHRG